jgi:hypothetical protein
VLRRDALRERVHECRRVGEVARPLGRRDHDRERTVGLQAVVEQAEGLRDPPGVEVLLVRQRLLVHRGCGVAVGVLAERHRDVGEVVARRSELVHVPAREQRDLVDRAQHAERAAPLPVAGDALADLRPRAARPGGPFAGPPRDGDLTLARRHRHGCLPHDAATGTSAEPDLAEPRDVTESDAAGDVDLARVLHRVEPEPVDVRRRQAGVVDGHADRLARERELRVGEALPEGGLTDPDDRGPVGER